EIFDELTGAGVPWVGVARCNDLIVDEDVSSEAIGVALGECLSGVRLNVVSIAQSLTTQCGAGVLLIDTLDLIIDEHLVPAFRAVISRLLDYETTIVFTCRDHEYGAFLEPVREKLTGVVEGVDRYRVPEFTPEEVEKA